MFDEMQLLTDLKSYKFSDNMLFSMNEVRCCIFFIFFVVFRSVSMCRLVIDEILMRNEYRFFCFISAVFSSMVFLCDGFLLVIFIFMADVLILISGFYFSIMFNLVFFMLCNIFF